MVKWQSIPLGMGDRASKVVYSGGLGGISVPEGVVCMVLAGRLVFGAYFYCSELEGGLCQVLKI